MLQVLKAQDTSTSILDIQVQVRVTSRLLHLCAVVLSGRITGLARAPSVPSGLN